jgi:AraC-like DNA-binding protein
MDELRIGNMKALVLKRYGGLDHVAFTDIPRPALKPDEILVQVHAAGLNPIDYMIPKGTFKPMLRFQLPATLGSDLAGVVSGAYGKPFVVDTREHASIIGVHFRPGGAFPVFHMPVIDLHDSHVDLETLWGGAARDLRQQLCEAATSAERFCILERTITSRLSSSPDHHSAVRFALDVFTRAVSNFALGDLVEQSGYSQRRFNQLFKQEVGMKPKLFARIRRFQQARESIHRAPKPNWAQLAFECGYFDQSHLINEFREFSGLSPLEYVRQRSERVLPNHVPLTE